MKLSLKKNIIIKFISLLIFIVMHCQVFVRCIIVIIFTYTINE